MENGSLRGMVFGYVAEINLLDRHHVFAYCVSLCQIAIALSAVAALTKRPHIWYLGLASGAAGFLFLVAGFLQR